MARESDAEPVLRDRDFEAFRPEKHRDPLYNEERLQVRRRLAAIAERARLALERDGIRLQARAGLHHPYKFNRFKVDSQRAYLSRSKAERRPLKTILGVDLGRDVDADYIHLILVVEIALESIRAGLWIHKDAWWDGENLKRKLSDPAAREAFAGILRGLPEGFRLWVHDWRRRYDTASIAPGDLARIFSYYTPGEHTLQILREIPRGDPRIGTMELTDALVEDLRACGPAYRFALWSPENNYLFGR